MPRHDRAACTSRPWTTGTRKGAKAGMSGSDWPTRARACLIRCKLLPCIAAMVALRAACSPIHFPSGVLHVHRTRYPTRYHHSYSAVYLTPRRTRFFLADQQSATIPSPIDGPVPFGTRIPCVIIVDADQAHLPIRYYTEFIALRKAVTAFRNARFCVTSL